MSCNTVSGWSNYPYFKHINHVLEERMSNKPKHDYDFIKTTVARVAASKGRTRK